jgi:hypothetical protein
MTYCDGGLINNYPFWVFNNDVVENFDNIDKSYVRKTTIGLKLFTKYEENSKLVFKGVVDVSGLRNSVKAMMNSLFLQIEREQTSINTINGTIAINTHDIAMMDLGITIDQQKLLKTEGENGVINYFNKEFNFVECQSCKSIKYI